jgi:hypothetical protein
MKVAASVSLVICAAALPSAPAKGQEAEAVSQAKAAATSWLALVDAGNYAASWQQTAGLFQSAIVSFRQDGMKSLNVLGKVGCEFNPMRSSRWTTWRRWRQQGTARALNR